MERLTKAKLQKVLTRRLHLKDPEYHLEKVGDRLVGNVISQTFKGKRDHQRLAMIWDALEVELGKDAPKRVGMILAYTPDEWNLDELLSPPKRKAG